MPEPESKPIQVFLSEEEQTMFEQLKSSDIRNTSDMVRFLIRQEHARRMAQIALPGFTDNAAQVAGNPA